jgi:ribonuclease III
MNFVAVEKILGYSFQNISLLERALTHRSFAYEKLPFGDEVDVRALHNETLEFVGDSVLGLAIAEHLFIKHPKVSEGDLTLMKHRLVSMDTLAKLSEELNLGDYVRFGKGELKTGGRKKQALLADVFEALIGAIFFDSGYISARGFVGRIFLNELKTITPKSAIDFKSTLQEKLQAKKMPPPVYTKTQMIGPSHKPVFHVDVTWGTEKETGIGNSLKEAEMRAAQRALKKLADL